MPNNLFCFTLILIFIPALLTTLSLLTARSTSSGTSSTGNDNARPRKQSYRLLTNDASLVPSRFRLSSLLPLSLRGPASLFPPSAIISLTDDNATFFLARPAAFGPVLPPDGLSAKLWLGGGFEDDDAALRQGGFTLTPMGELGCSDLPGWDERVEGMERRRATRVISDDDGNDANAPAARPSITQESIGKDGAYTLQTNGNPDDGTDDYFNPSSCTADYPSTPSPSSHPSSPPHADIQSLQETSAITGKVVLLSRGGCGFLDKVKWAQRRGARGVIVGDNVKGGNLVTMYAQGDTSNITIPALFTSYTTAHLLSSLAPVNGGNSGKQSRLARPDARARGPDLSRPRCYFLRRLMGLCYGYSEDNEYLTAMELLKSDRVRPPQSGNIELGRVRNGDVNAGVRDTSTVKADVIGRKVQEEEQEGDTAARTEGKSAQEGYDADDDDYARLRRDGWVRRAMGWIFGRTKDAIVQEADTEQQQQQQQQQQSRFSQGKPSSTSSSPSDDHGLWVTLTPATMSTSPLLDTLLVLVVSPLITLSVVYTMLLIRSRLRRRRWRAPKSIVDRLPVRTYHTIQDSPSASSLGSPSVLSFTGNGNGNRNGHMNAGEITPASPLLAHAQSPQARQPGTWQQQAQQPSNGTLIPHSTRHSQHHHHRRHQDRNNGEKILSQSLLWKRKYHNRQVECAVCLEEYIDGQSRVMSLPCGHEFHAECITPWLTTRRRTCPICKGDVVRSLAQWGRSSGSSSGSRRAQEQDRQYQAASSAPLPSADSPELMGGDMSERAQGHVTIAQDEIVLPPGEAPYEDDDDDLGSSEDGYDYDLEEGITISSPQARRRDSLADARRDAEAEEISAQARATILAAQQGDRYRPASSWQEFAGLGMGVSPFSGDAMWPQPHEQQRRQQGSGQ